MPEPEKVVQCSVTVGSEKNKVHVISCREYSTLILTISATQLFSGYYFVFASYQCSFSWAYQWGRKLNLHIYPKVSDSIQALHLVFPAC